jgi:pimeloyl-ACP methyl ester carboxylesterase
MTSTVMLIHGAWLTPASWRGFKQRYEARGLHVVAPPWPFDDRSVEELQRAPHPELRRLTVGKIVEHYDRIVRGLPEPPIIVGHSFGGFFTQALLDRGLGAAGVAIDALPPRGVLVRPRALWSALPVLLAFNGWNRALTMRFAHFSRDFANGLPDADQRGTFEREIVPTPGRIYFQAALGIGIGVDWSNPDRAPLLLIAGENDKTVTASMVRAAHEKYSRSPVLTDLKSFPGRSHFLCGEPGWEEVADYAIDWALKHRRAARHTDGP